MRTIAALAALVAAASPLAAQHQHGGGNQAQHGAGHAQHAAPAGWTYRLDRENADRSAVHFMQMNDELHFMLGPSGIFYNPQNTRTGAYRLSAEFQQMKAPAHPEAYGLILGARNLDAPNQDYLYFLVRGGGQFAVKHRAGSETHTVVDWTDHSAIRRQGADGKATNELAVDVTADAITYLVNGVQVHRQNRGGINTSGVYGLRINHNLDVHVKNFTATGG